jgi:putative pyruvate formate lyase activating enzyme
VKPLGHLLQDCRVCPNSCGVNRLRGEVGRCRVGGEIVVASAALHFGEERELVGAGGSGTIFLAGCSLSCVYCQNADISQSGSGKALSVPEAARLMISLQARGAENINLVTPTHQAPLLFEALQIARRGGLRVPVVYNCSGYESVATLREIDGLVQIYMPDMKYGSDEMAERYSGIQDYVEHCRAALLEMQRQVGVLVLDKRGVAQRGLLVRHLVLPNDVAGSHEVIDFVAERLSPRTALNVMAQYQPAFRAREHPPIGRRISLEEVDAVRAYARSRGMTNLLR